MLGIGGKMKMLFEDKEEGICRLTIFVSTTSDPSYAW
jgi:hypothetical protein